MTMTRDWTPLQGDPGADETLNEWAAEMLETLARMSRRERDRRWAEMTPDEQDAVRSAGWVGYETSVW